MRIAVVTSDVPLVEGGHRVIARALVAALAAAGHEAEMLTTPQNRFGRQLSAYLATWLTDVRVSGDGHDIDRVISLRFPAYAVRHPCHVVWLNHRLREYYDLWPQFRGTLGPRGKLVEGTRRRLLHLLDNFLLRRCNKVFAQSETIRRRLERWGGIAAEVLYPPPPPRPYRCEGYGGPILAVGRLTPLKRIDLLLRAAATASGWRVRIAGDGPQRAELARLASGLGIGDRVDFLEAVSEQQLVDEYARCAGVFFGARAEDYGMVTLEAFASAKPVVTCADSEGPSELVEDGVTGYVVEPRARDVAEALARLTDDPGLAERLGTAAASVARKHQWPEVVQRLLA
ncbi:MAG: glycosyltransferase [Acidobacteriota bacterium]